MAGPDSNRESFDVDVLIVGSGFGGVYAVHKFRQLGFSLHVFEGGQDIGGVWMWNSYPGARVDSEFPLYQLSIPKVYRGFKFTERFPAVEEIRDYFNHVDRVLDIRKDVSFNAEVVEARYDQSSSRWRVKTKCGHSATCKYLLLCTGSTYKGYTPDFKGMGEYSGIIHHTNNWPRTEVDVTGKKVAVIGQGASGVQVVQELAKKAEKLTVFQRTTNICLPMVQRKIGEQEQESLRSFYGAIFSQSRLSYGGFPYDLPPESNFSDVSPADRERLYETLYWRGGFNLLGGIWGEYTFDAKVNREVYDFWARKTRLRISDPLKREILAPTEPPHPFGCKRHSLEQDYYEIMDSPHVDIVEVKKTPITRFTQTGIETADGKSREFDIVVLATGFNNYTGAFLSMGLKDTQGVDLSERWRDGVYTYLGLMTSGYPNMFMIYGPQAPTAIGNGPTLVEAQIDIVADFIVKVRDENISRIEPEIEAEKEWRDDIQETANASLMPSTDSWYMGANIPGKKREMYNYIKGLPEYERSCRDAMDGFKGFKVIKA